MHVTLYTRVWIEIIQVLKQDWCDSVTLYTRVWIEMGLFLLF